MCKLDWCGIFVLIFVYKYKIGDRLEFIKVEYICLNVFILSILKV